MKLTHTTFVTAIVPLLFLILSLLGATCHPLSDEKLTSVQQPLTSPLQSLEFCDGIPADDPKVCNGHGQCVGADTCICEYGYWDSKCTVYIVVNVSSNEPEDLGLFPVSQPWKVQVRLSTRNLKSNTPATITWRLTEDKIMKPRTTFEHVITKDEETFTFEPVTNRTGTRYEFRVGVKIESFVGLSGYSRIFLAIDPKISIDIGGSSKRAIHNDESFRVSAKYQTYDEKDIFKSFNFGYWNKKGHRVFLGQNLTENSMDVTLPFTGNVTMFAQATSVFGEVHESTSEVTIAHQSYPDRRTPLQPFAMALIVLVAFASVALVLIALTVVAMRFVSLHKRSQDSYAPLDSLERESELNDYGQ